MVSSPHMEDSRRGRGTGKGWDLQPQQRAVAHLVVVFFVGKTSRNSLAGINKCRISPLPFHLPVRCHNLTFNGTREESDELVSTGKGEEREEKGAESQ